MSAGKFALQSLLNELADVYQTEGRAGSDAAANALRTAAQSVPESPENIPTHYADALTQTLGAVPLDMIQLHGSQTPQRVRAIKDTFHMPIIKALNIATKSDIEKAHAYTESVEWFIFDSSPPNADLPGGTGEVFDWALLEGKKFDKPWMLSGGLNETNVQQALQTLSPDGIDVSSGVESARGIKDTGKIVNFIKAVKSNG